MLSTFKTTFLIVMASTLFGFTEYGKQTFTHMRGTASATVDQGIDDLADTAHQYVKAIAPPATGHGFSLLNTCFTLAAFFAAIAFYHDVLTRIMNRKWPDQSRKTLRQLAWNFVSMSFCVIVAGFGILKTQNVMLGFISEFWEAVNECGFLGTFMTDCSINSFNQTSQLVRGLDYVAQSSQVMFITLLMTAYFIYDLILNRPSREYIYHHLLCLACVSIYILTQSYAFYVACASVTELSTIFLSASYLFDRKSNARALVMIEFCVSFFVSRILFLTTLLTMIWLTESGTRFITTMSAFSILYALNFYWFVLITRKVFRVCRSVWGKYN